MLKSILAPRWKKRTGEGLPRDRDLLLFTDDQYPVWPLTSEQSQYASIDGARMKRHVVDLGQIAVRYRDAGHKWWGRLPGTTADREGMLYMASRFEDLGLTVEHFPYVLPRDWRPTDWAASYETADGSTIHLGDRIPRCSHKGHWASKHHGGGGLGGRRRGSRFHR